MNKTAIAVARRLGLSVAQVEATITLLDEGATVPFISRYRKERTGSLDEVAVRNIETTLAQVRELEKRKEFVVAAIEEAGAMTDALRKAIDEVETLTALEDIYAPFKPKRRTRAQIAREKGYEPLAKIIMAGKRQRLPDDAEAVAGAKDIIAEWASESVALRNMTRRAFGRRGIVSASVVKGKEAELEASPFVSYRDFSKPLRLCSSHQYLALKRAERLGLLKLKYTIEKEEDLEDSLCDVFLPRNATKACSDAAFEALADGYKRLLRPSIENEVEAEMKEKSDAVAIEVFASNLRQLLLAAPLQGKRVLALDPGFRTGCKVVALDAQGTLLDESVIYPTEPRCDTVGAARILKALIAEYKLDVVALGNGTASRETEAFLKKEKILPADKIFVVNESGASVYSASDIARSEFPDKDVTVRGAVSIGRRLIDPLAELVKIDPKSIGVGQYQHDVDQSALRDSLDFTVMSCVNAVGVNVNTASEKLLSYISGIGPSLAANIVAYRRDNGDFTSRAQLKRVPRMGEKAFEQSAGFLRVPQGDNPLDNTGIHPESYAIVSAMARGLGVKVSDLPGNEKLLGKIDLADLVADGAGSATVADIIAELRKPGRDPRTDSAEDAFAPDIDSFNDLKNGMVIHGQVNNITAFGAFVDLGIHESGLLHISELSHKRVDSVGSVLKVGQILQVKVIGIDESRRRISLSIKDL